MPRVAIIYLTFYDEPQYIDAACASIAAQTYAREDLELIVVDNSCHGPSAQYVKNQVVPRSGQDLPNVTFVENSENVGFAEGNNQGIMMAREKGCEYVFLLNNDAKLDSCAIRELVDLAESDARIGAVQAFLCLWNQPDRINSSGNAIQFLGFGLTKDYGKRREDVLCQNGEEIGYASGAAVLYRLSALEEVGNLESFFWMYHEDLELGWRLRLAGWKNVIATRAVVYHDYQFSRSTKKMYWMERNRWLTHLALLSPRTLLLLAPAAIFMEGCVWGGALLGGWFPEKAKSVYELFRPSTWKWILQKRQQVQGLRRCSDREVTQVWVAQIAHQEVDQPLVRYIVNPVLKWYWNVIRFWIC